MLKASEYSPWTHHLIVETFLEAGFPPGTVNMIMSKRSSAAAVTETVIAHPGLAKVEFIGSAVVGKQVGAVAAKYLKPIIMELGDQSPLIVLDDADLEKAATEAVAGCIACHGQICFGTERLIVQKSVMDKFVPLLKAAIEAAPPAGNAVTNAFAKKAKELVDDALQRGAKLLCGANEYVGAASVSPSILIDVPDNAALSLAEGFCPTMFVVTVDTDEEAIAEANSRDGGLSASIFTTSWERGFIMAKELDFGNVNINFRTNTPERKSASSSSHQNNAESSLILTLLQQVVLSLDGNQVVGAADLDDSGSRNSSIIRLYHFDTLPLAS